jgi:Family of unknown function (DUF6527)
MAKVTEISYTFVDSAPQTLEPARIYISTRYRAIVHLCLCGCGEKVLLNLDPDGWSFTFDGRSISIHDSVGNVGMPCRSHYIVRRNRVVWLPPLSAVDPQAALGTKPRNAEPLQAPPPKWLARWFDRLRRRPRDG